MSETSQGPGWWQASDGKWYAPNLHPNYVPSPPTTTGLAATPYPAPQTAYQPGPPRQTNGLAIASLVLSILWLWGVGSLLAVIFGARARRQIRVSGGHQGGDGLAIAGITIGIIGVLGAILASAAFVAFRSTFDSSFPFGPRFSSYLSCTNDAHSVASALQAYDARNGAYPTPPEPWSAATYATNFSALTTTANGGPFLAVVPSTTQYVIEYDSNGHV